MYKFPSSSQCTKRNVVMLQLSGRIYALVSFVLLFLITGVYSRTPPTIIDVNEDSISISKSDVLTLTCKGEYPVTWKTHERKDIKSRTSEKQSTNEHDEAHPYLATLTVTGAIYTDTGRFTCHYSDGVNSESSENKADVYVFVKDPDNLLLPCSESGVPMCIISVQQSQETAIPCQPTSLDVNVALWKGIPDQSSSQKLEVNGIDVTYNPTRGFIISYASAYYSGEFYCIGGLKDKSQQLHFILQWFPSTDLVPTPIIHKEDKYAILNSDFTLTCTAKASLEVYLFLNWIYPGSESPRIKVWNETHKTVDSSAGTYRETQRKLTVSPVENIDQGTYTCAVKDHTGKSNRKSTFIEVRDIEAAFIHFKLDGVDSTNAFDIPIGKEARFVVTVDAFPPRPKLTWSKYNVTLASSNKYHILNAETTSTLVIYRIQRNDTGEYVLNGITGNASGHIVVTLIVTEPPEVKIQSFAKVHQISENFNITCHIQGCPVENATWEWKMCKAPGQCESDYRIQQTSEANSERVAEYGTFEHGCNLWSVLSGRTSVSGYYRCSMETEFGKNSSEVPLFISDFKDEFNILDHPRNLFEQDNLKLLCYASLFYYSNIEWWVIYPGNISRLVTNTSNVFVFPGKTNYSMTSAVNINPVVMENAGVYVCRATLLGSGTKWEEVKSAVYVTKPQPPTMLETNLNSTEYKIVKEDNFEFICRATGLPTPNIAWYLNGTKIEISNSSAMQLEENGAKLSISRVLPSDSGRYVCQITNRAGHLVRNATLIVLDVAKASLSTGGLAAIIVVVVLFVIAASGIGIALARRLYRERKERQELEQLEHMLFYKGDLGSYNPALPLEEQIDSLPYDNQWEFPRERLKLGRTIGQGAFGRVVKAEATGIFPHEEITPVAVKMLKERADWEQRKALMQELKIMIHLGRHINVVNLLGAVTKNLSRGELQVIVEYCRFGNLRHYLLRHRENFINQIHPETGEIDHSLRQRPTESAFLGRSSRCSEQMSSSISGNDSVVLSDGTTPASPTWNSVGSMDDNRLSVGAVKSTAAQTLTTYHLLGYTYQICSGMQYLVSKKLVHRDLALRNILLADGDVVKICDFGLTKDVYKKSYYRKKGKGALPIKWMAIESIRDRVFSTESDVWSFGIVLWETFTLGANPYPGLEVDEEFFRKLSNGYRMEKPPLSTESMNTLMLECWRNEPKTRPSFDEISSRVAEMLDKNTVKHYHDLNDDYLQPKNIVSNPYYLNMLPNDSDYINVDESGNPFGKSEYVSSDKPLALNTKSGTVNYINMPSPEEDLTNPNQRAVKYGDDFPTNFEKEPMLRHPENNHFHNSSALKPNNPASPPPQSTNPFLSPISANTNPFLTNSPSHSHDGYLDMGSKMSLDTDADISFGTETGSPFSHKGSPPPRYTTLITNDLFR